MSSRNVPQPRKRTSAAWRVAILCLPLLVAIACGPDEEESEVAVEESVPPPSTDVESAPLEPSMDSETASPEEETPPEETRVDPEELEEEIEEAEPAPPSPPAPPAVGTEAAGREVFLGQRCDTCHGVGSAGIEAKTSAGGDLTGAGSSLDRAAIAAILEGGETPGGKRHPKKFSGSQEELDALIDWLLAQE